MDGKTQTFIEEAYGFHVKSSLPGPRQFVAETFILELDNGIRYFVKLIRSYKYSHQTIQSLPILEELYKTGFKNINYPIRTISGQLHILYENVLIIIFNYIDAPQSFAFENKKLGRLTAELHQKTSQILRPIPKEKFD